MTRHEALARVMRGVGRDLADYRLLQSLLERQFDAALRHQTTRLEELAERVTGLAAALEQRRCERVLLVKRMGIASARMSDVFELLSGASRTALESGWATLHGLVLECKRLNTRNCQLLMDQHGIMQRVLHGEMAATYAPA